MYCGWINSFCFMCDKKFEATKWVIRSRKSKNEYSTMAKIKRTNNDLLNTEN